MEKLSPPYLIRQIKFGKLNNLDLKEINYVIYEILKITFVMKLQSVYIFLNYKQLVGSSSTLKKV